MQCLMGVAILYRAFLARLALYYILIGGIYYTASWVIQVVVMNSAVKQLKIYVYMHRYIKQKHIASIDTHSRSASACL